MNLLYLSPLASRGRAAAAETRMAVEDGHRVTLLAEGGASLDPADLDPRVETVWLDAFALDAGEAPLTSLLARRAPLGLLRRASIGPLSTPADRAADAWKRKVLKGLDADRKRRTAALRETHRLDRVNAALAATEPDWIVLGEAAAVELAAEFLPALLAERPATRTTYAYERGAAA